MKTGTPLTLHGKKCCHSICCFQKCEMTIFVCLCVWLEFISAFLGKATKKGV